MQSRGSQICHALVPCPDLLPLRPLLLRRLHRHAHGANRIEAFAPLGAPPALPPPPPPSPPSPPCWPASSSVGAQASPPCREKIPGSKASRQAGALDVLSGCSAGRAHAPCSPPCGQSVRHYITLAIYLILCMTARRLPGAAPQHLWDMSCVLSLGLRLTCAVPAPGECPLLFRLRSCRKIERHHLFSASPLGVVACLLVAFVPCTQVTISSV